MARGWESKSVEQQQAEMGDRGDSRRPRLSAMEQENNRKREGLLLSRKRLVQQLQSSSRPQHRQMLEQAIADLDKQISYFEKLNCPSTPK